MYDENPDVIANLLTAPVEQGGLMPGLAAATPPAPAEGYDPAWLTASERAQLAKQQPDPAPAHAVPAPAQAAPATAATVTGEAATEYEETWLSDKERSRIAAAREGRIDHGPVQFEDDDARRASAA